PSSSIGIPLTQEEAEKRALAHNISMRLDGMIKPKEEKAMEKMKGQMLKEKKDPGAFIFPFRLEGQLNENALADIGSYTNTMPYKIYKQLGRDDIMKEDRNITMINYTEAEVTGRLELFTTFVEHTRLTSRAAKSEKIKITESDSDDEEDYVIKRNDMGTPIHNSRPLGYQNNTNPAENMTLSTLESVINPFRKISVWKKAVSFLGSLPAKLRDVEWKPDYKLCYSNPELATGHWKTKICTYDHEAGSSRAKRFRNVETVEEALLLDVHHEFLEWRGCSREAKSRYNSRLETLLAKLIYSLQIVVWQLLQKIGYGDEIDQMLKINLEESQSDKEIFFSVARVRAFNIREPIYPELCREFYATYEFDEVCVDDELQSKKIISFRLGGRAHSLTLTTLRGLIDSEDSLIPDISVDDVPRVATQRALRVQRASMQDLYERMGSMEIRHEAIKRMEYRQAYHWDRYQGVFEHMAVVYNFPLQGAYNPPGYAQP
ncbi:hypothetical protein Tco_0478876, partial [Tanacetum coccineum]